MAWHVLLAAGEIRPMRAAACLDSSPAARAIRPARLAAILAARKPHPTCLAARPAARLVERAARSTPPAPSASASPPRRARLGASKVRRMPPTACLPASRIRRAHLAGRDNRHLPRLSREDLGSSATDSAGGRFDAQTRLSWKRHVGFPPEARRRQKLLYAWFDPCSAPLAARILQAAARDEGMRRAWGGLTSRGANSVAPSSRA